MAYLLGTDEAGYGPNLGPLIVSATLWEVPDGVDGPELGRRLAPWVVASPGPARGAEPRVAIGDSKVLYQPHRGPIHLETGLWAAWHALGCDPATWREVWQQLAPGDLQPEQRWPWYGPYDRPLPIDADRTIRDRAALALQQGLEQAGARLLAVRCRAIFPEEFNRQVAQVDSKGAVLSHATLKLAADLIGPLPDAPVSVVCDKHGGRDRYQPLLAEHFPDQFIEIHGEGRTASVYRFGPARRRVEFRFQTKADCHVPAALASMAAKYLRELAMQAWNEFWCGRVAGLRPTAGYPVDAERFHQAIAPLQKELGINDAVVWRSR